MMTDGQWALLAPLLPAAGSTGGRGGRPEKWDRRLVLDAIFYLVRDGIAWRALPADFPRHCCIKRSAHPIWSTCSPRSHVAGVRMPGLLRLSKVPEGSASPFWCEAGRPSP
jgi:transposase